MIKSMPFLFLQNFNKYVQKQNIFRNIDVGIFYLHCHF